MWVRSPLKSEYFLFSEKSKNPGVHWKKGPFMLLLDATVSIMQVAPCVRRETIRMRISTSLFPSFIFLL